MLERTIKELKLTYWITMAFAIVTFVAAAILYISKNLQYNESAALERWAIVVTLGGIFVALKLFHPKLKENEKANTDQATAKYSFRYKLRLGILALIYVFNMVSFYFTGTKNFMFLGFIIIFAMLLCIPNRQAMESEIEIENEDAG